MGVYEPGPDGELQIEVGPLRPSADPASVVEAANVAAPPPPPARSWKRGLRRGIIVGTLVVVVTALMFTLTPTRDALRAVVLGPMPTATAPVAAGQDNLYVTISPRWGDVSLDGRTLGHLPVEAVEQPLYLSRGSHVLRWRFDPIIDYACRLTVPSVESDTCPLRAGILPQHKGLASVTELQLSLNTLTPTYRATLISAMQAALDTQTSSAVIRTGERYWGPRPGFDPEAAQQPLQATLRFVLDADNADAHCPALQSGPGVNCVLTGDCREICTIPGLGQVDASSSAPWQGVIVAHASWRITTLDGTLITPDQPDIGGPLSLLGRDERPLPITIAWDGSQWQAQTNFLATDPRALFGDPSCITAQDEVDYASIYPPGPPPNTFQWHYVPGSPRAEGCLAANVPENLQGTPAVGQAGLSSVGLVLHRFGVALTANAAAHRYWPFLPMADAYEQALALRLAQLLPGIAAGQR